jgi:hypothetical protein
MIPDEEMKSSTIFVALCKYQLQNRYHRYHIPLFVTPLQSFPFIFSTCYDNFMIFHFLCRLDGIYYKNTPREESTVTIEQVTRFLESFPTADGNKTCLVKCLIQEGVLPPKTDKDEGKKEAEDSTEVQMVTPADKTV